MGRRAASSSGEAHEAPAMPPFDLGATPLTPGTTLIEASAGTGKTYAIVGLCVRLLAEIGLRIDEIVVTTFTIPATAELRERLRGALVTAQRALDTGAPAEPYLEGVLARHAAPAARLTIKKRIEAALRDFDQAFITTIHGFCQRLLRDQAFESGALFETEFVADQTPLLRATADDFWRAHF
jgi:exodeoxyribonuclease V beta subunit